MTDKLPPHDPFAEQAILGACLLRPQNLDTIALKPADFWVTANQHGFRAMQALWRDGVAVDEVTVGLFLKNSNQLPSHQWLYDLTNNTPVAEHIGEYVKIVKEASIARQAMARLGDGHKLLSENESAVKTITSTITELEELRDGNRESHAQHIRPLCLSRFDALEKSSADLQAGHPASAGFGTGLLSLDGLLSGGLRPGCFDLLAARPGGGKTALMTQLAWQTSVVQKVPTLIISVEMPATILTDRILCQQAKIVYDDYAAGKLSKNQWDELARIASRLVESPLWIDDESDDANSIPLAIGQAAKTLGVKVIFLDYLQLVSLERGRGVSRDEVLGGFVNSLARKTKKLGLAMVACAQLNREIEKRGKGNRRPILADLRESGNLEQAAWRVMCPWSDEDNCTISVIKNRNGQCGDIAVRFEGQFMTFHEIEAQSTQGRYGQGHRPFHVD